MRSFLKIKKFRGDSENAVRIQIYTAIISYCIVAVVHDKLKLQMSVYNTLQVLEISLTYTNLSKATSTNLTSILTKDLTRSMNPRCLIFNF